MSTTLAQITTTGPNDQPISIEVTAEETSRTKAGKRQELLKVSLVADGTTLGSIEFAPGSASLEITGLSQSLSGYAACLATCGLGHLVTDVIDCWRRGNKSVKSLIACLKRKGHHISLNLINCAIGCLASLASAGGP